MADTVIDTLSVKVTANAQAASQALKNLSSALTKVRNALTGVKDGATVADHLSKSLNEVNSALQNISNNSVKKLDRLSTALQRYADAAKSLRNTGRFNIGQSVKNVGNAIKQGEAQSGGGSDTVNDTENASKNITRLGIDLDKLKTKLTAVTSKFTGFFAAIKRIAMYRMIRSAIKAITEAFDEGLKSAYYFSQQNQGFSRLAETLDRIKSITTQMTNQLGALWGEIKQFILPAIEWIVEKVRSLSETLTELFAALNGEDTYLRAKLEDLKWDDAIDSLKEYKHQLLGLDELNNLSKKENSKQDKVKNAADDYDIMPVSAKFKKLGQSWNGIKSVLSQALDDIDNLVIGAELGIGALLVFSGANIPLGLFMLAHGAWKGVKKIKENWGGVNSNVEDGLNQLGEIVGGALFSIGLVLALTGNVGLGIGAMVLGATSFGISAKKRNWDKLPNKVQKELDEFIIRSSAAELAIGAILALSGVSIKAGIPLMLAGAIGLWHETTEGNINWSALPKLVESKLVEYFGAAGLIATGAGMLAIGALLAFSHTNLPLGIALLASGALALGVGIANVDWKKTSETVMYGLVNFFGSGGLIAIGAGLLAIGAILTMSGNFAVGIPMLVAGAGSLGLGLASINWDAVLDNLKGAWDNIKNWWNSTVVAGINKAVEWIEDKLSLDLNGDGQFGSKSGYTIDGGIFGNMTVKEGSFFDKVLTFFDDGNHAGSRGSGGRGTGFALGGVPENGSLFYAGESGAEFVGNIGHTSAVANTEQMTEAIYKAAYMGMSKALQENSDNGMSGFEPATTDDLFIAMRKKASNYNKTTGNSAFA